MVLAIPKDRAFSDPSDCDKVLDQRGYGCGPKYLIEGICSHRPGHLSCLKERWRTAACWFHLDHSYIL